MIQRISRFRAKVVVALGVLISIFIVACYTTLDYTQDLTFKTIKPEEDKPEPKPVVGLYKTPESHKFWETIFDTLENSAIEIENFDDAVKYVPKEEQLLGPLTKEVLLSRAIISDEVISEMKLKHDRVLENLPKKFPTSTYKKGSRGVVMVGGGRYSWLSYLSILSLRQTGSELPVEVVIPTIKEFEREDEFCSKILPALNASCILLADTFGPMVMLKWQDQIKSYQYKSLALMSSTFQHILLLDSDNFALQKPELIFDSELYAANGMITWPDYWQRTVSPKFYEIAGIEVNELKRVRYNRFPLKTSSKEEMNMSDDDLASVPFHDLEGALPDLSTESGQLMINKATHGKTLMLSLYYNVYGPKLYYKLFSLGEQGEGDKDTFVAAAEVTGEKYYQLKSFILTAGYLDSNNKFEGVAMGQKDPLSDYQIYQEKVLKDASTDNLSIDEQIKKLKELQDKDFESRAGTPLFTLHCNYPKLDPLDLITKDNIYEKDSMKLKYRLYGNFKYPNNSGDEQKEIDFEATQWAHINKALCEDKLQFEHFSKANMEDVCSFAHNQVNWLSSSD
ncbi:glycosyltransferase family 71 protein [Suhomyces tanzawaensis NRRL Y-17324]|uniref:Glycosyltransferase family 71 protein n=1 Tax=Suhomyces tanzawaensis NRRL Y-17324 TaxID=984487 RepID=A0A1E4SBD1_9ASCO|nr:glycosyltransferase family 71 protein [Suhomyces tanzawaensis NRRL Y-17324]ODV76809.1 glycosyltransferase family 71 protein [Suhomyces tanzawaensis NRRL Y-17324]